MPFLRGSYARQRARSAEHHSVWNTKRVKGTRSDPTMGGVWNIANACYGLAEVLWITTGTGKTGIRVL